MNYPAISPEEMEAVIRERMEYALTHEPTKAAKRALAEKRVTEPDLAFGTYIAAMPVNGEPFPRLLCAYCDRKAHRGTCESVADDPRYD